MSYDFQSIESKWKPVWANRPELYSAKDNDQEREKKYILVEFPYPSGSGLHIGHAFTFTGGDVYARFQRMRGYNVLFPMGWDAFGLPTENYAIKMGLPPQKVTDDNTKLFKQQCHDLALSFDWAREVNTTEPGYYRWTQWIFVQLFKKGLAYKKEMPINWCPSCKIGLANEEVVDGKCERCGAQVTKKTISQWIVKITEYADRLIDDLSKTDFIEKVKAAQINWIDRSSGITIDYPLLPVDAKADLGGQTADPEVISCYSTRPDTNFGATFIVLAPELPICLQIVTEKHRSEVERYIKQAQEKSERERIADYSHRTGVFTGRYAINRLTGKKMPVYVADFVIATAGTGMVVGVPAHDERDFDFSRQYDLEIIPVIAPDEDWDFEERPFTEIDRGKMINSDFLNGLVPRQAKEKIIDYLEEKGWGRRAKNYHLRDWIFSRQHYWGEPIPMVYCEHCASKKSEVAYNLDQGGWMPVPEDQLPVTLPQVEKYEPTDTGESPLAVMTDWVTTTCPVCGGPARRETDTMPNWAGSDWYFIRYTDPHNSEALADTAKMKYWLPVDVYVGGDEHNTLHLLYSRFIYKFLSDIGAVPNDEPYFKRLSHGVILGPDGSRMSKSRGNVVVPDEMIKKYGADAVRTYLMFIGPFDGTMVWNERAVQGVARFLAKVQTDVIESPTKKGTGLSPQTHRLIKKVTQDIEAFKYNTAVAAMMEYCRKFEKTEDEKRVFIRLLAPFAPYLAEELWEKLGGEFSVHQQSWPEYDGSNIMEDTVEVPVQINGKVRAKIMVDPSLEGDLLVRQAKLDPQVSPLLEGKIITKEIGVGGKIVSFVIS